MIRWSRATSRRLPTISTPPCASLSRPRTASRPITCQQAAEKLVKAVLVHRRIHPGIEHRIDVLVRMLDPSDPWQPLLDPLDRFTPYATTYRYPSPTGRLKAGPNASNVLAEAAEIEKLLDRARRELSSP